MRWVDDYFRRALHKFNRQKIGEMKDINSVKARCPINILNLDVPRDNYETVKTMASANDAKIDEKIIFHTYWWGEFGRKQAFSIKSLFASQYTYQFEVWLWLDEDCQIDQSDTKWLESIGHLVKIKSYSINRDVGKSALNNRKVIFDDKKHLAFRADGFRMWALHEYGGIWFDLDIMFIRDLGEIIKLGEFIYGWEKQSYGNNALIYLRKSSPLNDYIVKKIKRTWSTQPWILFDYKDVELGELIVWPATLFDPLWKSDSQDYLFHRFQDFFVDMKKRGGGGILLETIFPYSYVYHWHNMWSEEIEEGSPFALLEKEVDKRIK